MTRRYALYGSSDEETDDGPEKIHSDARLESGLRETVARIFESGKLEELTVKRVRLATENALGLEEGFFKGHEQWKARSDKIIKEQVAAQDIAEGSNEAPNSTTTSSAGTQNKKTKITPKRDSEDLRKARKRRKIVKSVETEDELSSREDLEEEIKDASGSSRPTAEEAADRTPVSDGSEKDDIQPAVGKGNISDKEGSESEMSVVLDEPAPKKRRQKSSESAPKKGKAKGTTKANAESDPDQAEIKRLQGWLVKCGIRKVWSRELAPYETPKAKIKHLKSMLEAAGMKGRYSLEKARQIRDERELQADLEAVKEGAMKWGTGGKDEGSDGEGKPRRRLIKGRQSLAFLSDDGEETD